MITISLGLKSSGSTMSRTHVTGLVEDDVRNRPKVKIDVYSIPLED